MPIERLALAAASLVAGVWTKMQHNRKSSSTSFPLLVDTAVQFNLRNPYPQAAGEAAPAAMDEGTKAGGEAAETAPTVSGDKMKEAETEALKLLEFYFDDSNFGWDRFMQSKVCSLYSVRRGALLRVGHACLEHSRISVFCPFKLAGLRAGEV